jgi:hypothetical protein
VVEGRLARQHLIRQHSYRPNVHEVVIGLPLQYLGADIVEGAAVCIPPFRAVGGPPEIAQLANTLNIPTITLESTIFSGLISL